MNFALEDLLDLLRLVEAHAAVVHEYAREVLANGLVEQHRAHGAVDAAGHRQQHLLVAHLGADRLDLGLDVGLDVQLLADFRGAFLFCLVHLFFLFVNFF